MQGGFAVVAAVGAGTLVAVGFAIGSNNREEPDPEPTRQTLEERRNERLDEWILDFEISFESWPSEQRSEFCDLVVDDEYEVGRWMVEQSNGLIDQDVVGITFARYLCFGPEKAPLPEPDYDP